MAQLDGMRTRRADEVPPIRKPSTIARSTSFSVGAPTIGIATVEQLLRGGGEYCYSRWPSMSSITASASPAITGSNKDFDPEDSHHSPRLTRSPSVLALVKNKWIRTLSVRSRSSLDLNATPSWGVSLDDIDDHFYEDEDDDPDHPTGAIKSEKAPTAVIVSGNSIIVSNAAEANPGEVIGSVTDPAPAALLDQVWDKGISVKDYITQKFGPGEDEKALSEMIAQAISPRSACNAVAASGSNVVGVLGKMKDAVNSVIRADQVASSFTSVIKIPTPYFPQLVSASTDAPQPQAAAAAVKEENHGQIVKTD